MKNVEFLTSCELEAYERALENPKSLEESMMLAGVRATLKSRKPGSGADIEEEVQRLRSSAAQAHGTADRERERRRSAEARIKVLEDELAGIAQQKAA